MNLENGQVLYVGDGRQEEALQGFWKKLRRNKVQIEAVASDMSRPYTKAIRENLPDAVHVFDHFRIVKMFNEVIDNVRRSLFRKIKDKDEKSALYCRHWGFSTPSPVYLRKTEVFLAGAT